MSGKLNYPIGPDEIPRRLAELKTLIEENNAAVLKTVVPIVKQAVNARDAIKIFFNQIDGNVANNGILQPTHGGTGTNNAYNREIGSTTRRAVWMDTNGSLGYALSSSHGKKDIQPTQITENMLRAIDIVDYRFTNDPENAPMQIGVIAEQVETHIPDSMIYKNTDSYDEDIDDPDDIKIEGVELTLFGILALRLAQINSNKIDQLQKQNQQQKQKIQHLTHHIHKLEKRNKKWKTSSHTH